MVDEVLFPASSIAEVLAAADDRSACRRRLTRLLVDRSLRELARVRFDGGGPPELVEAFENVEEVFVTSATNAVAVDPERSKLLALDRLSLAYRDLFRSRHRADDLDDDVELVALGVAEGLRLQREDRPETPSDREPDDRVVEDVPEAWLLRLTLRLVVCVVKTRGFLGTTFEDDEIVLEGVARYGQGTATARGPANRDLTPYAHVFDKDDDDPGADRHEANRKLDEVAIARGTTHYIAQHTMFEEDWFDEGSPTSRVLARALSVLVSFGLDLAFSSITAALEDDVDGETDPDRKRRRQKFLDVWASIRDSEAVQDARDDLEASVFAFFKRLFEPEGFNMFTTLVDIEWDPSGLPTWRPAWVTNIGFFNQRLRLQKLANEVATYKQVLEDLIKRGADREAILGGTEILSEREQELELARARAGLSGRSKGDPDQVVGAGSSLLTSIPVAELDDGSGEYWVTMEYEMIPARLAPV